MSSFVNINLCLDHCSSCMYGSGFRITKVSVSTNCFQSLDIESWHMVLFCRGALKCIVRVYPRLVRLFFC